mgnify:CR=1 FL=1
MLILQDFYGRSDGTRIRDLRRDRPVMALPAGAWIGGDSRRVQGFATRWLRGLAVMAGTCGDLLRDQRGMDRCPTGERIGIGAG